MDQGPSVVWKLMILCGNCLPLIPVKGTKTVCGYLATDVETDGVHSSNGHLYDVTQSRNSRGRGRLHDVGTETELSRVTDTERHDGTLSRNYVDCGLVTRRFVDRRRRFTCTRYDTTCKV